MQLFLLLWPLNSDCPYQSDFMSSSRLVHQMHAMLTGKEHAKHSEKK